MRPDFDRYLFDPRRLARAPRWRERDGLRRMTALDQGFVARNRFGSGHDFTSSRLIPADATTFYPHSTAGKLFFSIPGEGDFICSGAVVSARIVVTAGHCLYRGGGFADDVLFVPAYDRGSAPFGEWVASRLSVTGDWQDSETLPNSADFGFLVVEDQEIRMMGAGAGTVRSKIGQVTGWLGFALDKLSDNHVHKLGYPANHDGGQRMHQTMSGDFEEVPTAAGDGVAVLYGSDMRDGADGGPWVQNFGVKAAGQRGGRNKAINRLVGVSSFTSTDSSLGVLGSSIFSSSALSAFDEACAAAPGNCQKKGKPKKN